jgi:hypothetical protein
MLVDEWMLEYSFRVVRALRRRREDEANPEAQQATLRSSPILHIMWRCRLCPRRTSHLF